LINDALREEVLRMFAADQAAVQAFVADADRHREAFEARGQEVVAPWPYSLLEWQPLADAPSTVKDVVETVARNISPLREIIAGHGWPGRRSPM
jgi:hypothetical protein